MIFKKKIKSLKFLISGPIALLVIFPHLLWLLDNNFITITYGFQRTGGMGSFADHIILPVTFVLKQLIVLVPFFIMCLFLLKKLELKKFVFNDKKIFLLLLAYYQLH